MAEEDEFETGHVLIRLDARRRDHGQFLARRTRCVHGRSGLLH
jgi:hypothetical protein